MLFFRSELKRAFNEPNSNCLVRLSPLKIIISRQIYAYERVEQNPIHFGKDILGIFFCDVIAYIIILSHLLGNVLATFYFMFFFSNFFYFLFGQKTNAPFDLYANIYITLESYGNFCEIERGEKRGTHFPTFLSLQRPFPLTFQSLIFFLC